jgi:hypothetical protein
MTAGIFDNPRAREWLGFTTLRRVCIAAAVVHFLWQGCRVIELSCRCTAFPSTLPRF